MSADRRIALLTQGRLDAFTAKTAVGLLRFCPDEVVAVIDSEQAGADLPSLVGVGQGIPVVASVAEAIGKGANQILIGVALPGGQIPDEYRVIIEEGLRSGLDIVNGLHMRLNDDEALRALAAEHGCQLVDVRVPPVVRTVGSGKSRGTKGKRILTVGTDCNLGKRVTALELTAALQRRGENAAFVATGQTGVMISGRGVVLDAVVSDFVSGAIEAAILEQADADWIIVEGQGALLHPGYSAVTLGLLHGTLPDMMVMCHAPARACMRNSDIPVVSPSTMAQLCESVLAPLHLGKTIGLSLNCHGMSVEEAAEQRKRYAGETGWPVVDSFKTGVEPLVDAILKSRS